MSHRQHFLKRRWAHKSATSMPSSPHIDIPDTHEELVRMRRVRPGAVMSVSQARLRNSLVDRYRWAKNRLLRVYRGTNRANGWRDGDFSRPFIVGSTEYRPVNVQEAEQLYNRLSNGLWAAYLLEYVANVDLVGTDKEKRLIREPLERGGFRQIDGRDWTKADEARRLFRELDLPQADFVALLVNVTKPGRR